MLHRLTFFFALFGLSMCNVARAAEITDQSLANGAAILSLDGEISLDDADRFRALSQKYNSAVVVLNSAGGRLFPALEIGRIIKSKGYTTLVADDAICASACALIWVASTSRFLSPLGNVGFHASYRDNNGKLEESGVANALIGSYLAKLDFSESAIIFATSAPPTEISWLHKDNKLTAEIEFYEYVAENKASQFPNMFDAPRSNVEVPSRRLDCALINAGFRLRSSIGESMTRESGASIREALFGRLRAVVDQCAIQYNIVQIQREDYFKYSLAAVSREWLMMDIAKDNLSTRPVDEALDFGEGKTNPDISNKMTDRQIMAIVQAYIENGIDIDEVDGAVWEKVGAYAAATSIYWNKRKQLPF